jgi:hypothetical protein
MSEVARTIHDALDALSPEEDVRSGVDLLARFIARVDFGTDVERTLEFASSCRRAYPNLDDVKVAVIEKTLALATTAHGYARGRVTPKIHAFVRAV